MKGVKVLRIDNSVEKKEQENIPNSMTMAAIREIENGKDAGFVNMNSLLDFDYASPNGKNPIMKIAYFDALS